MTRPSGLGILCSTNVLDKAALAALASGVERHGYETLWYPESLSYETFAMAGFLLSETSSLKVASGIANIYARDAMAMKAIHQSLNELSAGGDMPELHEAHPVGARGSA